MRLIFGLLLTVVGFTLASIHLKQGIQTYWDFVAFAVVLFGTASVMFINRPKTEVRFLWRYLKKGISKEGISKKAFVNHCVQVANSGSPVGPEKSIEHQLLRDGRELIDLGFKYEKIEAILTQRYQNYARSVTNVSHWLRKNAKYPPAFGLAGTVLGLIHLMRGISDGINTQETGIRMAVALVATFYGLIISNIFLNPIGELVQEQLKYDEEKAEIAIHTIQLMSHQASAIEVQEELNSYVEGEERVNVLSSLKLEEVA